MVNLLYQKSWQIKKLKKKNNDPIAFGNVGFISGYKANYKSYSINIDNF